MRGGRPSKKQKATANEDVVSAPTVPPSTTGTISYDKKIYVSDDAYLRFSSVIKDRQLIMERAFIIDHPFYSHLEKRGWLIFSAPPMDVVVPWVREFYANGIAEKTEFKAKVRGKWIFYDKDTINKYYELEGVEKDEFVELCQKPDYDVILEAIGKEGAQWNYVGDQVSTLPLSHLATEGKCWLRFICANLMPSSHTSTISKKQAVLLYCITALKKIDVGAIIQDSIHECIHASGKITLSLRHPSLITALCGLQNVQRVPKDAVVRPTNPIERVRNEAPPLAPTNPRRTTIPVSERLTAIEGAIQGLRQDVQAVRGFQQDFLAAHRYQVDVAKALSEALTKLGVPTTFPDPPSLPTPSAPPGEAT